MRRTDAAEASMSFGASVSDSMGLGDSAGLELGPGASALGLGGVEGPLGPSPHHGLHFDHEADEGLSASDYRDMIIAEAKAFTEERLLRKEQRKQRKMMRERKRSERAAAASAGPVVGPASLPTKG